MEIKAKRAAAQPTISGRQQVPGLTIAQHKAFADQLTRIASLDWANIAYSIESASRYHPDHRIISKVWDIQHAFNNLEDLLSKTFSREHPSHENPYWKERSDAEYQRLANLPVGTGIPPAEARKAKA